VYYPGTPQNLLKTHPALHGFSWITMVSRAPHLRCTCGVEPNFTSLFPSMSVILFDISLFSASPYTHLSVYPSSPLRHCWPHSFYPQILSLLYGRVHCDTRTNPCGGTDSEFCVFSQSSSFTFVTPTLVAVCRIWCIFTCSIS
jgi:hypothetical protein